MQQAIEIGWTVSVVLAFGLWLWAKRPRKPHEHDWEFVLMDDLDPDDIEGGCKAAQHCVLFCPCGMTTERIGILRVDGSVEAYDAQVNDWKELGEQ